MRILAILFCLCLIGCNCGGVQETQPVHDRFSFVPQCRGFGYVVFILTDTTTERQYIVVSTSRGAAITPLLGEMEGE